MERLKKNWWNFLGVLIVLYSIIAGMLIPLSPGIDSVSPTSIYSGQKLSLQINGYNSSYLKAASSLKVWMKADSSFFIPGQIINIENETLFIAEFDIPESLPLKSKIIDFTLVVNNENDGSSILPSAVFVTQNPSDSEENIVIDSQVPSELFPRKWVSFPYRNILKETIRNTYYHVPLWFSMIFIFFASVRLSIKTLRTKDLEYDRRASAYAAVGLLYGILGVITGAIWAKNTWGAYWSFDVKQNMTAIALLIYFAYFVLRSGFSDQDQKAKLSAVYNIFAFATLIPLLYIIPRLTDSLHPGSGGNPAFGGEDLDNTMRLVFYPAIIGWTLIGIWMSQLLYRFKRIENKILF
jgi:heme exporter protein C